MNMKNMYATESFCAGLIQSIINYMTENKVKVFPLEFLANRNDYSSCEAARKFYNHGIKYFTVVNGELHVHLHYNSTGNDYDQQFEFLKEHSNSRRFTISKITINCQLVIPIINITAAARDLARNSIIYVWPF